MALSNASFLPSAQDCAETWRAQRWPEGVECVACSSKQVQCRTEQYRDHLCRYKCQACGKWFNDLSGTPLGYSKVSLNRWVYLMRELDKGQPVTRIAADMEVTYKTALQMAHTVREVLYEQDKPPFLSGEVEGDDIHLKAGQQGHPCEHREARQRGLKQRGRGTYAGDRPLICLWTQRGSPKMVIEMVKDASQRSLVRSALRHIDPGSRVDTDSWRGYNILGHCYDHRQVKHAETYVQDGVHCNTAEGEWSVFKPWWATFRGVAKRHIYLYLAPYQFRRNRRHLTALDRLEEMIGFIYAYLVRLFFRFVSPCSLFSIFPLCYLLQMSERKYKSQPVLCSFRPFELSRIKGLCLNGFEYLICLRFF
jgi:transposase-like protein